MLDSLLDQLARQRGIGDAYHNWRGDLVWVSSGTKRAILQAMGLPTDDAAAVERALQERDAERWRALLPPVAVVHPGRLAVVVAVPAPGAADALDWRVTLADGGVVSGTASLAELHEVECGELDGHRVSRRELPLPATLAHGYHTLQVKAVATGLEAECALIVAPTACFEPQALHQGRRLWGVAVQLYTLRTRQNWGIGDFADLADVVRQCSGHGAAFIGLNPLHALFPANPWQFSPYSPSSRHFLNVMYIAVERVAEFDSCAAARAHVAQPAFQAELARLRATPVVDYPGVARAKLPVLRLLHAQFRAEQTAGPTPRGRRFQAYVAERGESLRRHALHDALDMQLRTADQNCWGWPVWPEQYRDPTGAGVGEFERAHAAEVEFHAWLQWLADEQLGAAQALARELGMPIGLYGDYAVGVNPSGSETWSDQALYRKGAGVGAPPDALALKGQDWGIPPQDPNVLVAEQYQPFRQLIAANMRHFGALRLDHVMALFRQWWVPVGLGATEGGYVHYPLDDLLSVLALESERHGCLVVGEDLGTVPPEMSHAMAERVVYSYRVLLFEKHADGRFKAPAEYPRRAIATVTTHDLPTLNGYWSASDVSLRQRLELYPSDEMREQVLAERVRDRHALLSALSGQDLPVADCDGSDGSYGAALSRAIHEYLARTAAALVILQAEDLVGMPDPVNVPGTSDEHANWQRKMALDLDAMFADPAVTGLLRQVAQARST